MKLQSPKKRRKLYTAKRDVIDFYDDDEPDTGIEKNVENILSRLQEDKDVNDAQAKQLASPCKVQVILFYFLNLFQEIFRIYFFFVSDPKNNRHSII